MIFFRNSRVRGERTTRKLWRTMANTELEKWKDDLLIASVVFHLYLKDLSPKCNSDFLRFDDNYCSFSSKFTGNFFPKILTSSKFHLTAHLV